MVAARSRCNVACTFLSELKGESLTVRPPFTEKLQWGRMQSQALLGLLLFTSLCLNFVLWAKAYTTN